VITNHQTTNERRAKDERRDRESSRVERHSRSEIDRRPWPWESRRRRRYSTPPYYGLDRTERRPTSVIYPPHYSPTFTKRCQWQYWPL
jgi:hypothetical protein